MNIGSLAATSGLAKPVDYAARDSREFAGMAEMQTNLAKEKADNIEAQKVEAEQYAAIATKASEMLAPHRGKINAKAIEFQKEIRSKIEEYGSRRAFFDNGGLALISKYKTDILNSEETLGYLDSKKNLETLMLMQKDGKGHLMSERDAQKLKEYNAGIGDGQITYSGMKTEVVLPERYEDYKKEIAPEIILKNQYLPIYNNWLVDNPDKKDLQGDALKEELLLYTMNHYYGEGVNKEKQAEDFARQRAEATAKATQAAGTGTKAEKETVSFIQTWNNGFQQAQTSNPATVDKILGSTNYSKSVAAANPVIGKVAGNLKEANDFHENVDDNTGVRIAGMDLFDSNYTYRVAGGVVMPFTVSLPAIQQLFPGSTKATAVNVALNQNEFYAANGSLLSKEYIDKGTDGQPMKLQSIIMGYVDEENKMITKIYDDEGKPLGKTDKKGKYTQDEQEVNHRAAYGKNATQQMFAVLKDSDGSTIYKAINSNSYLGETELSKALGSVDNITSSVEGARKKEVQKQQVAAQTKMDKNVIRMTVTAASGEGGVFDSLEFKAAAKAGTRADGSNRTKLMKAYYLAASASQQRGQNGQTGIATPETLKADGFYKTRNENNFMNRVNYSPKIKDAFINFGEYSDEALIDFMGIETAGNNEEDIQANNEFNALWKAYLKTMND